LKESRDLKPVVAAIDLSSLKGPAKGISQNGKIRDIHFPDDLTEAHIAICLPAPLPTAFIDSICFLSKDDKTSCVKEAKDYGNVPMDRFSLRIDKKCFGKTAGVIWWDQREYFPEDHNVPMDIFLAVGGMAAMLLNFGNMGDLSILACKSAFGERSENDASLWEGSVAFGLGDWVACNTFENSGQGVVGLFWEVVNRIIDAGMDRDFHASYPDAILDFLIRRMDFFDPQYKNSLAVLVEDLKALLQFGEKSATELFQTYTQDFHRALILFFLRDRFSDLLEFSHPLVTEKDYVAASLLFAAREKWIGLPLSFRNLPGLDQTVSHRMAAMAHECLKTGVDPGPLLPRCKPLRELLLPEKDKGWSKKQQESALNISRGMKWDCISTRIRLGKGDYVLRLGASGLDIVLPGEVKAVETEIDMQRFFSLMTKSRIIESGIEAKARELLV